jgi:hypothetical protein
MCRKIPPEESQIRKNLFCAFALPHFFWLFSIWLYFTEKQKHKIQHVYCSGIRLINNLWRWNNHVTLSLAREKSLLHYVYDYWQKFTKHLNVISKIILEMICYCKKSKVIYRFIESVT